ncbi:ATP-dependent DNA helicase [Candidatus Woesearchaeota archaeon]|jgi:DNA excision repair protein ERCC-2|nr:ATP-dependent DNA helicase [Candidatus Woesearchaeota archaeon]MBT4835483.1 ATP-dependent DNA helicase [Candidatus Woesearchaeota archaeon]MBT6734825.1 ATP-dependent DNA helicase [Candidatus Woesearchaeota archaeon]MBT7169838.1 ATP-dependent DNA helicase [Candidatus Woesearchaeota archaeon]MBT7474618.1 ATP-dependent DNA helicase [Candidatus Woesearchaeota archaeon]
MQDLFPFDSYRKGQESFIRVVNTALNHKKDVLAQVPTGVGKTAATLAPSLKYAIENDKTVLFLTSKHTHHKVVVDTLKQIKEKSDINFQVADFIGKRWMCPREDISNLNSMEFREFCKSVVENKECEYYENYRNKEKIFVKKILIDELKTNILNVDELVDKCRNAEVCSFEAASDLAKKSRVIILDYFHVLNSGTRERFFKKIGKELKDCILIWDEAHNLPSRARSLMSEHVSTISLDSAVREAGKFNQELEPEIVEIGNSLLNMSSKLGLKKNETIVSKNDFISVNDELITKIYETSSKVVEEEQRSYLNSLVNFLQIWKKENDKFSRILKRSFTRTGKPIISLFYNCLDPSIVLDPILEESHSNIFMSGTLYPLTMYEEMFGLKLPLKVEYPNPFPAENRLDLVVPAISTKFDQRNGQMYEKIAHHVSELMGIINGNKIFFFPSYAIMGKVLEHIDEETFIESPGMDKYSRELILKKFISMKDKGATLFAVSSGSFGESIDLDGDKLKGVIIVGVPFARNDLEIKELTRYYDERFGKGMEYAYIMPAFTSIMQNAGRCIRSETDKGIIIYLDERYAWGNYRKNFPEHINLKGARSYEDVKDFMRGD